MLIKKKDIKVDSEIKLKIKNVKQKFNLENIELERKYMNLYVEESKKCDEMIINSDEKINKKIEIKKKK